MTRSSRILYDLENALAGIVRAPASEVDLHGQIATCLERAGMMFEREFQTSSGPVDFLLLGDVAVEVKISGSALAVARQITRYLQDDRLSMCVLVTTRPMSLPMERVGEKLVLVLELWRNFI